MDLPAGDDLARRVVDVLGRDLDGRMVPFEARGINLGVFGLASEPSLHRSNAAGLHFFVNNRPVRDPILIKAVRGKGV